MISPIYKLSKTNRLDLFLVFMLIAVSGTPFFVGNRYIIPAFYLFAVTLALTRGIRFNQSFIFFTGFTILLLIAQMVYYEHFALYSSIAILVKITLPFFILSVLRISFMKAYVTIMYRLALISLFLYISFIIIPGLRDYVISNIARFFIRQQEISFTNLPPIS